MMLIVDQRGHDPIYNLLYRQDDGALSSDGRVAGESICRACGYNLYKQPETGRCPECGAPVGVSVRGDLLKNSRPDWIIHIAHATQATGWVTLLMLLVMVLLFWSTSRPFGLMVLAMLLPFWSWTLWQASDPEPTQEHLTRPQLFMRAAAVIMVCMVAIAAASVTRGTLGAHLMGYCSLVSWAMFVFGSAAQMRWLAALLYRVPTGEVAATVARRGYYMAGANGLMFIAVLLEMVGFATCCLGLAVVLASVAMTINIAWLQLHAADMLRVEWIVSEANWHYHEQVSRENEVKPPKQG